MYADASDTVETSIELLREFEQTGDAAVFELFMRRHAGMVYATCLKVTRDPHDAEDATQATFLTLASKSKLNGEIRQPEAWLRKVAHRLSLDLIRSKKRRVNRENARSEMNSEEVPLDSHDHADRGEMKSILNEELAKLPASYRMPLVLHYFGGLSREEMAAQLKLKPSTLGVRLHRAREQLRKRLAGRGVVLPGAALSLLLMESVQFAIGERMVANTAAQASAMVVGQHSASLMSAGVAWTPSATMIQSITDVIARSKVKMIASVIVLGSALGATNAQVQKLLPAVVRDWIPTFRVPSLPVPRFENPLPKLTARNPPAVPSGQPEPMDMAAASARPLRVASVVTPVARATPAQQSGGAGIVSDATVTPITPAWPAPPTVAMARIGLEPTPRALESTRATISPLAIAAAAPRVASRGSSSARSAEVSTAADLSLPGWGTVIADRAASGGSSSPWAGDASADDVPESLLAPVIGESPLSGGGGGGGGGGSASLDAGATAQPAKAASSGAVKMQSQTVVFAGASANYGGYSDDEWKASPIADLSGLVAPVVEPEPVGPTAPTQGLSVNGARVTLNGVTAGATSSVSFLDTESAAYPALPAGHHFIGAWSLDTSESFASADLLVRYDDLRAARMGLSEQILKLWVSDGASWTLMWHDPSFGRDVNENLIWVTAAGGFQYFAVSAPEPATIFVGALVLGGLSVRRRRR